MGERKKKKENIIEKEGDKKDDNNKEDGVELVDLEHEIKSSYIDYAMSVIVARALPDVRDGLKPVHRRILYAMHEMGLRHNSKYRKSATVVGRVLGSFHPHGDQAIYDSMVRLAQDFSLRHPLVDGQGNFGCFTKDTKVQLVDGRALDFGGLIKESEKGKRNYVYTFNPESEKIEITEIKNPRLTRKNEQIIEITIDNGERIKCTLDHRFMLRNGRYKHAKNLKLGDSLMPLYRKIYEGNDKNLQGCETIYQPVKGIWEFGCCLIDEWVSDNKVHEKKNGRVGHYINLDFDKLNNWKYYSYDEILSLAEMLKAKRKSNSAPKMENTVDCSTVFQVMAGKTVAKRCRYNHKVIKIKILPKTEDVYDITVDPWHNFALAGGIFVHNSVDGDKAAAYRYTESRMTKIASEMLVDIDQDTVDFVPNYDGTTKEPSVLPAKVPNLLINGSMGIAVGMATNIPPHNLAEVCDAIIYKIDNPDCDVDALLQYIKGPDFPTGGFIFNDDQIKQVYASGKGPIVMRAKTEIVEKKLGVFQIIINELPYQVNKASLLQKMAELVKSKRLQDIKDIRDESDKHGVRIVIELKKGSFPQKVLNRLFKLTDCQQTFHVNMVCLVDKVQPKILSLKRILEEYIKYRQTVIKRRTKYNLIRAKEAIHILEGLQVAIDNINQVIELIKKSENKEEAKNALIKKFGLTDMQAQAILEIRLHQLAHLERQKNKEELNEKKNLAKELEEILANPGMVLDIIKKEVKEIKIRYGDERRTKVIPRGAKKFKEEDLIPNEPTVLMITRDGYIKRVSPEDFKIQNRGGRGVVGFSVKDEDSVEQLIATTSHANVLFFTTKGRVFQLKAYDVPQASRVARGKAIVNFLEIQEDEKISTVLPVPALKNYKYLFFSTKKGVVKKVGIDAFKNVRRSGLIALKLRGDDVLTWTKPTSGEDEIVLVSGKGQAIRFREKDLRPMGRTAFGVRGIRLKADDLLVGAEIIAKSKEKGSNLLIVTENGFGKTTTLNNYHVQGRGGLGLKTAKISKKTGRIVGSRIIAEKSEFTNLLLISQAGQIIRLAISSVPSLSRTTQGVRLMRFKEDGDKVGSFTLI
ncbi:hypothetical protein B6D52_03085 [Candidatus Parcubacteria bacterium 4484_255]|nr:MAG: hypothetical protein B6D52_03085 [Candidatus Parcubacteria bacterium 4484_255]